MLRAWIDRLRARRRREIVEDYGHLTDAERVERERLRDDEGAIRGRGLEETYGGEFDQELDAEEGRPRT
ncbi:MAG: hypothetical protein ACXVZ4_03865 [Gaiellaceae bacterium]